MNKIGRPNYLSNDKDYLIVADAEIEGDHVLPLEINYILEQLQRIINYVKLWYADNDIINNVTPQVFPSICQTFQWKL